MTDEIVIARSFTDKWWKFDSLICETFPELIDINQEGILYVSEDYQIKIDDVYFIRIDLLEGSCTLLDVQNDELHKGWIKKEVKI
jgi:hypothetical protein